MASKNSFFNNFIWRFLERCGAQLVAFAVSIVLARVLDPKVYGTVALVTVFTAIMQVFIDSGVGTALIQKKEADDLDFSTVFFFNLGLCLLLYAVMFFCAPLVSDFYGIPELTEIVRVLSLTIIISGVKNIQQAYVSRNMMFKRFFFATLGGTVGAAVLGIWMAYRGYGVWALVAQHLFNTAMDTLILWITVKWRPRWMFSWNRLKELFSYGWKLLVSGLMDSVYNELRQMIIGKLYTTQDLAHYNRGKQFPFLIINNVNTSIDSVLLPTLAKEQDDKSRVRSMTRRAIKTSTYIMAPLMMGLAFIAEPLIKLLLTEKWLPCVPFLRIFCITYMFYPIHTANLNAIKAMGRSDLYLKLEIIKKVIGVVVLLCTMWHGVEIMAYSLLLTSVASQIVNSWPNRKLLDYSYIDQMKDILPSILLALFMGACVYWIGILEMNNLLILLLQIALGAALYIGGSMLFRLEAYGYLVRQLRRFFKRRSKDDKAA
ncbi:MAG: lipopolysaccharide biosynthesis protein [Ruminococcaceae bacterium]|nr:lipopolysaccharide biosynthesis protein [Oscillospiraceae bacterium]